MNNEIETGLSIITSSYPDIILQRTAVAVLSFWTLGSAGTTALTAVLWLWVWLVLVKVPSLSI